MFIPPQFHNIIGINMTRESGRAPIGPWSKDPILRDIGRYNLLNLLEGMVGSASPSPSVSTGLTGF